MALSALHIAYLIAMLVIIGFMVAKKDVSLVCIIGIFAVGLVATASFSASIGGIFASFIIAINELAGTILIISVITALCKLLEYTGISERMISPVARLIKTPFSAYWVIGVIMLVVSSFFWPSPAVALIGAIFLPVAFKAKMPVMGVAVAMNLFGHGIALSGDFVIQGAPKLAADGAGLPVAEQVAASIPLVAVMGIVTTVAAYLFLRRDMKLGRLDAAQQAPVSNETRSLYKISSKLVKLFAILVPLCFAADLVIMFTANLQGGDATALVGGTALLLLIILAPVVFKGKAFDKVTSHLVDGFSFGFKVFGPVIPVAAFFFLGDSALASVYGTSAMPAGSMGIVNDLGLYLSQLVPIGKGVSAFASSAVGVITGLDGSGFSGINLAGSVARIFSVALNGGAATLSALGQISAIWVGGGTIIPWAVIPVAAICGVSPIELASRNIKPVAIGLVVTTIVAIFLL